VKITPSPEWFGDYLLQETNEMPDPVTPAPRPGKGWWTLIASLVFVILGQLQTWDWITLIQDPKTAGWIMTGIGILMAALRVITSTPIGQKTLPVLLAVCLAGLTLGGCSSLTASLPTRDDVNGAIKAVQDATVAVCGFLPTVIQVGGYFNPGVATAGAAAQAICDAVAKTKPALVGGPTSRKVPVWSTHGWRVTGRIVNPSRFNAFKHKTER